MDERKISEPVKEPPAPKLLDMKTYLRQTFLLLAATSAFAQTPDVVPSPDTPPALKRYADFAALKKWAEMGSFGGGRLDLISHHGHDIAIINQSDTSGVTSSAVTIFVDRKTGWSQALRLGPYWNANVSFEQKGDAVTLWVAVFDGSDSKKKVLTFSIAALCDQFDDLRPR